MGRKWEKPVYKVVVVPNKNSNKTFDDIMMSKEMYNWIVDVIAYIDSLNDKRDNDTIGTETYQSLE
jgi:hypothetical protein